ncbi:uncharacterized protein LOC109826820 [Asparagus officinalis]|uniref:uncharacterized protein LOC109826820 n=1 Tax=Asparagus officinalis TaxID=4686 RepID=UPI00098E39E2|nr:uncharacterized protein LOC109826820 [Asparagus officinalis]
MLFGLKNAGVTYQRAMSTIFHEHLRKKVECYVDDIVVKSQKKCDHLSDLRMIFDIMRIHQLKMNPAKSFLGVSSGKFLGFIVTSKGRCQPFTKLMKKGVSFVWDGDCQKTFKEIKQYLTQPTILVASVIGKQFLLYVRAMEHSLGALLAQNNDEGQEQATYYLSRTMIGAEHRYNPVEKEYLALVFAIQKIWHYLVGQTIHLMPQKVVKGQVLADFLANHPVSDSSRLYEDLPDKVAEAYVTQGVMQVWKLFFDGASRESPDGGITAGVGVVLVSPYGQMAEELNIQYLEAYGDSQLIVNQVLGEYEVRNEDLILYHFAALKLAQNFEGFFIGHVPRARNAYADALASLATSLALSPKAETKILVAGRDLCHPKFPLGNRSEEATIEIVCEASTSLEQRDWLGYYWPKKIVDAVNYAKRYHACQVHGDFIHQAPGNLHPTSPSWSFEMWGMDIVGPIFPPTSKGHRFILAVTDYFSKWAEAVPLKEVKASDVVKFIKHHVVYRFGIPGQIVHDNGA